MMHSCYDLLMREDEERNDLAHCMRHPNTYQYYITVYGIIPEKTVRILNQIDEMQVIFLILVNGSLNSERVASYSPSDQDSYTGAS